jgi:hypothetical protein
VTRAIATVSSSQCDSFDCKCSILRYTYGNNLCCGNWRMSVAFAAVWFTIWAAVAVTMHAGMTVDPSCSVRYIANRLLQCVSIVELQALHLQRGRLSQVVNRSRDFLGGSLARSPQNSRRVAFEPAQRHKIILQAHLYCYLSSRIGLCRHVSTFGLSYGPLIRYMYRQGEVDHVNWNPLHSPLCMLMARSYPDDGRALSNEQRT